MIEPQTFDEYMALSKEDKWQYMLEWQENRRRIQHIASMLKCKPDEVLTKIQKLKDDIAEQKAILLDLQQSPQP